VKVLYGLAARRSPDGETRAIVRKKSRIRGAFRSWDMKVPYFSNGRMLAYGSRLIHDTRDSKVYKLGLIKV
jgi:hypothetical protein